MRNSRKRRSSFCWNYIFCFSSKWNIPLNCWLTQRSSSFTILFLLPYQKRVLLGDQLVHLIDPFQLLSPRQFEETARPLEQQDELLGRMDIVVHPTSRHADTQSPPLVLNQMSKGAWNDGVLLSRDDGFEFPAPSDLSHDGTRKTRRNRFPNSRNHLRFALSREIRTPTRSSSRIDVLQFWQYNSRQWCDISLSTWRDICISKWCDVLNSNVSCELKFHLVSVKSTGVLRRQWQAKEDIVEISNSPKVTKSFF